MAPRANWKGYLRLLPHCALSGLLPERKSQVSIGL